MWLHHTLFSLFSNVGPIYLELSAAALLALIPEPGIEAIALHSLMGIDFIMKSSSLDHDMLTTMSFVLGHYFKPDEASVVHGFASFTIPTTIYHNVMYGDGD